MTRALAGLVPVPEILIDLSKYRVDIQSLRLDQLCNCAPENLAALDTHDTLSHQVCAESWVLIEKIIDMVIRSNHSIPRCEFYRFQDSCIRSNGNRNCAYVILWPADLPICRSPTITDLTGQTLRSSGLALRSSGLAWTSAAHV